MWRGTANKKIAWERAVLPGEVYQALAAVQTILQHLHAGTLMVMSMATESLSMYCLA